MAEQRSLPTTREYDARLNSEIAITNTLHQPVAHAQMLIRKPVDQVFEALLDPSITSQFWFSKRQRQARIRQAVSLGLGDVRTPYRSRRKSN